MGKLILYNGPTSPFGRKVKIVSIVHEIELEEKIINIYEAEFLDQHNPLRKIPTLLINKLTIIDSDNICLYFDSITNNKSLFPKECYWQIMSLTSVANGLMEAVLERFMEISRPDQEKRKKTIEKLETRALGTIKWLENNWNNYNEQNLTMDQIAIACALDYTSFRLTDKWRKNNSNLDKWFNNFLKKDFMISTLPKIK
jgi:glutathione S-transferase